MNEQKEIRWWEKEFDERFVNTLYSTQSEVKTRVWKSKGIVGIYVDPDDIEAFISKVELDARKDERERVLGEVNSKVKTGENGEGLPFENSPEIYGNARIEAYKRGYNKACSDISTTVKSLSGNNE